MADGARAGMIDLHCHLLPGVDDGAADLDQARAALRTMTEQGVRGVVVTPHLDGSATRSPERLEAQLQRVATGWEAFRALRDSEQPELRIDRGAEVMLDTPDPDLSDPRVRMAGTAFVLVEFPFLQVPPRRWRQSTGCEWRAGGPS
jgi:protein-tyrosine phosphatase